MWLVEGQHLCPWSRKVFSLKGTIFEGSESQLLFFTCCVNLGKMLHLAKPHLPPLEMGMITYNSVFMINMILMLFFLLQRFSRKGQLLFRSPSLCRKEDLNNYLQWTELIYIYNIMKIILLTSGLRFKHLRTLLSSLTNSLRKA